MMQVVVELILGFLLCMYAGLTVPGNFQSIHPASKENRFALSQLFCFKNLIVYFRIDVYKLWNWISCVSFVNIEIKHFKVNKNRICFVLSAVSLLDFDFFGLFV